MIEGTIEDRDQLIKYTLDISQEELINAHVTERVLAWCKKYHPEVFNVARRKVIEDLTQNSNPQELNTSC
jgi:hypothetical protein